MELTAGEECQLSAKTLSSFVDIKQGKNIPPHFIASCMGIAVVKGCHGVAVVRLKTGDWSAPCAFGLTSPQNSVAPGQESILLFMTERSIIALVANQQISLGQTHSFAPGPLTMEPIIPGVDFYIWIRFNNGFTPEQLIAQNLLGWTVMEDKRRHRKWHGETVTWFDVLTNKISIDRSSIGNALYLVLNLAAGRGQGVDRTRKNYVDVEDLIGPKAEISTTMTASGHLLTTQTAQLMQPQLAMQQPQQFNSLAQINQQLMNQMQQPQLAMQQQMMMQPQYTNQFQMNMNQSQMQPQVMQQPMMMNQMPPLIPTPQMQSQLMQPQVMQQQSIPMQMQQNQFGQNFNQRQY